MRRGAVAALVALAACGRSDPGPVEIELGIDSCATCRMIISERPFSAQARAGTEVAKFDDIGCLVRWAKQNGGARHWVVDLPGGQWIDAGSARFVRSERLRTPMGSGLAAFASAEAAASRAGEMLGSTTSWSELVASR